MSSYENPQQEQHGLHKDTADFLFQRIEQWRKRNADNKCFYDLMKTDKKSSPSNLFWWLVLPLILVCALLMSVLNASKDQENIGSVAFGITTLVVIYFVRTFIWQGKEPSIKEPLGEWRISKEYTKCFDWGIQYSCWATEFHLIVIPTNRNKFIRHKRNTNEAKHLSGKYGEEAAAHIRRYGYSWAEVIDMGIQLGNEPSAEKIAINTTPESKQLLEEFCGIIEETAQFEQNRLKEEKLRMEKEQAIFDDRLSNKLQELDKDGNGIVDDIEGDDAFEALLKKHEALLVEKEKEFSQKFVHKFIRMSSYLTQQRDNIQRIFTLLSKSQNHKSLDENLELLQSEVHTYQVLLYGSINMVTLLADNKVIDFWKTYEVFDSLNVYDSNYQRQLAEELDNIGDGLNELMGSIDRMNLSMSRQLSSLHRLTESNGASMQKQLNSVNSNLTVNTSLNWIQIYQNHKTNKRLG
jgi:hypothetical protein